jgi:hypothetical protein
MKIISLIGILTLGLFPLLAGCGGNACEQEADAETAKDAECGVKSSSTLPQSDNSVCPELFAKTSECEIGCIDKVTCDGYTGKDFDAHDAYTDCRLKCF